MNRRRFLGAAATLTTLSTASPATGAASDDDPIGDAGAHQCDICGGEVPASMVKRTTVPEIAPIKADICRSCRFVHQHTPDEGVCDECGDDLDVGYSVEIKYPLGAEDLPAFKSATLCGDCASWIAVDINHRGTQADDEARERYGEILDEKNRRMRELEKTDE